MDGKLALAAILGSWGLLLAFAFLVMAGLFVAVFAFGGNEPAATPTPYITPTPTPQGGQFGHATPTGTPTPAPSPSPSPMTERPYRGAAYAPVTIIEYSDFQCPFCSRAAGTMDQLLQEYPGQIKLIYMNFPLGFHENAQKAAEAFECAADQGKAFEMHDKMFANQQSLSVTDLKRYASELGMDTARFSICLDTGAKAPTVQAQIDAGVAAGVQGTPTFFINGKKIVGSQPLSVFKAAVDEELG